MGGAVAVAGHLYEGRALDGLAAAGALERGRVDEQEPIAGAWALRGEVGEQPLNRVGEAAATLEVGRLARQMRKEMEQALARRGQEPAVAGDAHDRLGDAEGDHFGVGDPPAGILPRFWQEIVGCAINDGAESIEVGVHRGLRADGDLGTVGFGLSALRSLDTADLVESII
jgi:hypothetical protein